MDNLQIAIEKELSTITSLHALKIVITSPFPRHRNSHFQFCSSYHIAIMPWSFALPQAIFTSPLLAVATPIAAGMTSALLTSRTYLILTLQPSSLQCRGSTTIVVSTPLHTITKLYKTGSLTNPPVQAQIPKKPTAISANLPLAPQHGSSDQPGPSSTGSWATPRTMQQS